MSATTDIFTTPCASPVIRTNIAVSGLLTACNAVHIPIDSLEATYKTDADFRLMSTQFMFAWEGKACQAKQNNFYNFIQSTSVNLSASLGKMPGMNGSLEIAPFINVKRVGPINNNSWVGLSGALALVDGTPDAAGTYWNMRASSPTGIPLHANWFIPQEWVFVEGLDGSGNHIKWAGEVVRTVVNGTTDILVTIKPHMDNSFLPTARKANPTTGRITRGVGNINKFKSFCAQPPGLLTNQMEKYWLGWERVTFETDSSYEKWRALIMADNPLYKEFFDLSIADYNRQATEEFQTKSVESFFNNTALAGQNQSDWSKAPEAGGLPLITTSADGVGGVRCVGREANPIGVFEQHVQCQRAVDAQGAKLNIPALLQSIYKMRRIRIASGSTTQATKIFEIGMPSNYHPIFNQGMMRYYKANWESQLNLNMDIKQAKEAPIGFLYFDYPVTFPSGVTIRVITDDYFDDYAAEMENMAAATGNDNYTNLGRRLWIIDWSRIKKGITDSKTVSNNPGKDMVAGQNLGIVDACVMETLSKSINMKTWQWTAIVDCAAGNLIIQNLSAEVPEHNLLTTDYDVNV